MVAHGSTITGSVWESPRLTRPDGQYVVRVVPHDRPLSAPEPEVAASAGLAGLVAVGVSSVLRRARRVAGRETFRVCLVELVPDGSRSSTERVESVEEVRGEREAVAHARALADRPA